MCGEWVEGASPGCGWRWGWVWDPRAAYPLTTPAHPSTLCRGTALDTQRHLAVFYLDTEASIRLTAEQARFFLVRPRPLACMGPGTPLQGSIFPKI